MENIKPILLKLASVATLVVAVPVSLALGFVVIGMLVLTSIATIAYVAFARQKHAPVRAQQQREHAPVRHDLDLDPSEWRR